MQRPSPLPPGFLRLCKTRTACPASSLSEEISPSLLANRKLPPGVKLSRQEEIESWGDLCRENGWNQGVRKKQAFDSCQRTPWGFFSALWHPALSSTSPMMHWHVCCKLMWSDSDVIKRDNVWIEVSEAITTIWFKIDQLYRLRVRSQYYTLHVTSRSLPFLLCLWWWHHLWLSGNQP